MTTKEGKRFVENVKHGPGDPAFGVQEERNLAKFRGCAASRLSPEAIRAAERDLLNLESVPDFSRVLDSLCA